MKKNVEIEKNIKEIAKNTAARIEEPYERKRAYALSTAALSLAKMLQSEGLSFSFKHSLFKIPSFSQNFELADLYFDKIRIDVRVTFDDKVFYIPKTHKKYDATPDLYVVVKMEKDLSKMSVEGFVYPKEIEDAESVDEYYAVPLKKLNSMKGFKKALETTEPKEAQIEAGDHQKAAELAVSFIDGEISESEKIFFIKHVVNCPLCRERICEFSEFDTIIEQVKKYPELLDDGTLNILTGNVPSASEEKNEPGILESGISDSVLDLVKDAATLETGLEAAETVVEAAETGAVDLIAESEQTMDDDLASLSEVDNEIPADENNDEELQNLAQNEEEHEDSDDLSELEESGEELNLTEPEEIPDFGDNSADLEPAENDSLEEEPVEIANEEQDLEKTEEPALLADNDELLLEDESAPMELLEEEPEENTDFAAEINEISEEPAQDVEDSTLNADEEETLDPETHDELELSDLELLDEHEEMILEESEPETPEETHEEPILELHEEVQEQIQEEPAELDNLTELEEDSEPLDLVEHEEMPDFSQETEEFSDFSQEPAAMEEETNSEELILDNNTEEIAEETPENDVPEVIFEETPDDILLETDEEPEEITIEPAEDPVEAAAEPDSGFAGVLEETQSENNEEQTPEYAGIELIDEDSTPSDEPAEESHPDEDVNPEIQGLLDDELMQLLSSDDDSDENAESEAADDTDLDLIAESAENDAEQPQEEAIDTLYENDEAQVDGENAQIDLTQDKNVSKNSGLAKKLIAAAVLLFLITAGGVTALYMNQSKQNTNTEALPDGDFPAQDGSVLDAAANLPQNNNETATPMSQDLNKSITNVFSDQPAAITITKISWEVSQSLANDDSFRNYLQVAGKNLQMNLQNDLSYTTEINYNPKVKVSFEITKENVIKRIQVTESSGSEQIDNVVLQSIKETLKYVNAPNIKDYKGNYNLSVVINF